jgi:hypothetical protein
MYSEILHEGEFAEVETQWRIGRALRSRQDVRKNEGVIFLARNASRHQDICGQMHNFPAFEGKNIEFGVLSTISHTKEAVGCNQHGFHIGVSKNTKRF